MLLAAELKLDSGLYRLGTSYHGSDEGRQRTCALMGRTYQGSDVSDVYGKSRAFLQNAWSVKGLPTT